MPSHRDLVRFPSIEEIKESMERSRKVQADRAAKDLNVEDSGLSDWAAGKVDQLLKEQLKLAEHGWLAWFPVGLRTKEGKDLKARLIKGRFGWCWARLEESGRFTGEFITDKPSSLKRAGVEVRYEQARAYVKLAGSQFSLHPIILRDSDDMVGGLLEKPVPEPVPPSMSRRKRLSCADCGAEGEMTGHQECQYPGRSEP